MILTASQIRALEQSVFASGASPEALMEEAGTGAARKLREAYPSPGHAFAIFGKGHNGGDALVVARELAVSGWNVSLIPASPESDWAPLTRKKFGEAGLCSHAHQLPLLANLPSASTILLLDGLIGTGSSGALTPPYASLSRHMNQLRQSRRVHSIALDLPSGLHPDTGIPSPDAVEADLTLTIGFPKPGLLADEALNHVGRLELVPLTALTEAADTPTLAGKSVRSDALITDQLVASFLQRSSFDLHKGQAGRVLVVAGSAGMAGAAVLCASGALRAGAGLVTLCVPESIWPMASATAPAPIMVRPMRKLSDVRDVRADSLVIGPGLGPVQPHELLGVLRHFSGPCLLDADALNHLTVHAIRSVSEKSENREILLTPHPGEMERLLPGSTQTPRLEAARLLVQKTNATCLLKGARTIVQAPTGPALYNTTGCPGMASGGMGDVLSGVAAAFLARGLSAAAAGACGAWLCGKTAQTLTSPQHPSGLSNESLTASDIVAHLGLAFNALP
jgi:NAD(P)H-hydrate epimerase